MTDAKLRKAVEEAIAILESLVWARSPRTAVVLARTKLREGLARKPEGKPE